MMSKVLVLPNNPIIFQGPFLCGQFVFVLSPKQLSCLLDDYSHDFTYMLQTVILSAFILLA